MTIFDEIDTLKAKTDSYRPVPPEKMGLIDEKFTLEWTYNSNAIEGNTLSRQMPRLSKKCSSQGDG